MLLQHFWLGLSKESALQLDIAAEGSFTHKTTEEGEALLDRILENTPPLEPLRVEPMLSPEEVSSAEAKPTTSIQTPSPEPEDLEEGFQPLIFRISRMIFSKILEIHRITRAKRDHQFRALILTH